MSLPERVSSVGGFVADCPVRVLAGGVVASEAEALDAAGAHDDGMHGGRPTTDVRPVDGPAGRMLRAGWCRYCGRGLYSPDADGVEPAEWFHAGTYSAWCGPEATTVATTTGGLAGMESAR